MLYVLEIDDEVISALKENELRYKDLKLSYIHELYDNFICVVIKNMFKSLYGFSKNDTKYLLYNEEKETSCCLYEKVFLRMNNIIDYKFIHLDDFSVIDNHSKQLKDFKQFKYEENSIITDDELKNKNLEEILYDK